jgi:hypothetical protein
MAKAAADRQSCLAHASPGSAGVLPVTHTRYLKTVRKRRVAYQRADDVKQQQLFVTMIHAFMQELCGYPPTGYRVTTAVHSHAEVGSDPHVVPTPPFVNSTLFYFTLSENPDDVHDLWVKHAQVYLVTPQQDVAAEYATQVVFTNFFIIDGASKDPNTGAWHLWSVSDIEAAQGTRIDLRILENETELAPTLSYVIQKRLQTIQYQIPPDTQESNAGGSEVLAAWTPTIRVEGHGA